MKYYLENEQLSLTFDSFGGTLTSIKNPFGIEYLWQGDKTYWSGQSPTLFPICGSIRNDQAKTKDGKTLSMPRHGIVRKREFKMESKEWNKIVFSITDNDDMFQQYPYHFNLKIEYRLIGNEIIVSYHIQNLQDEKMYFSIGGHPGFNCPINKNESYNDYYIEFEHEETCTVPTPLTESGLIDMSQRSPMLTKQKVLPLSHELFEKDAIIFDQLHSRKVILASHQSHRKVTLEFEDFPYFILWSSSNHGPFVAMEPWLGLSTCQDESDFFEEKRNIQCLAGHSIARYSYSIKID